MDCGRRKTISMRIENRFDRVLAALAMGNAVQTGRSEGKGVVLFLRES
jgi:hypothetical protein